MQTPQLRESFSSSTIGLTWWLREIDGVRIVEHAGATMGIAHGARNTLRDDNPHERYIRRTVMRGGHKMDSTPLSDIERPGNRLV